MSLQAVQYVRGEMRVLDQLKLPLESEYVPIKDSRDAWAVIRSMQVRGAPLIAIVAALGLAVEANGRIGSIQSPEEAQQFLLETLDYLRTSRPVLPLPY
jgi:methylthioribose-1-phosphate isomerase